MEPPSPSEVKERTKPHNLFQREKTVEIAGEKFKLKRMTLREELEWYRIRDETLNNREIPNQEKIIKIWEELLRRVVQEPKLGNYTEELPTVVITRLIDEITKLHLWDLDFHTSKQE